MDWIKYNLVVGKSVSNSSKDAKNICYFQKFDLALERPTVLNNADLISRFLEVRENLLECYSLLIWNAFLTLFRCFYSFLTIGFCVKACSILMKLINAFLKDTVVNISMFYHKYCFEFFCLFDMVLNVLGNLASIKLSNEECSFPFICMIQGFKYWRIWIWIRFWACRHDIGTTISISAQ